MYKVRSMEKLFQLNDVKFRFSFQIDNPVMFSFKIYLFKGDTLSLFIPKARKDMSGKYSVKVSNKRGCEECSCELTVGKYIVTKCNQWQTRIPF